MKPTLVELQSPSGYGKVPVATSGPPNSTNTGDIHKKQLHKYIIRDVLQFKPHILFSPQRRGDFLNRTMSSSYALQHSTCEYRNNTPSMRWSIDNRAQEK